MHFSYLFSFFVYSVVYPATSAGRINVQLVSLLIADIHVLQHMYIFADLSKIKLCPRETQGQRKTAKQSKRLKARIDPEEISKAETSY